MGQNDQWSSPGRAPSGEQISLQSLCALGALPCLSLHLLPQTPRECGLHLETTEFMASSSLCTLRANKTSRT